jgi:hypothetical protein
MTLRLQFPLRLVSEANLRGREHWTKRNERVQQQRKDTNTYLLQAFGCGRRTINLEGLVVTMTRIGPTLIRDSDNLSSSFKSVRDQLAAFFGFDDGDSRVTWTCRQEKGKDYQVRIELSHGPNP